MIDSSDQLDFSTQVLIHFRRLKRENSKVCTGSDPVVGDSPRLFGLGHLLC